jgi:signal transduction histidine kinase
MLSLTGVLTRGAGLGLAIVRDHTEGRTAGRAWAASAGRGRGSRFKVWLPV